MKTLEILSLIDKKDCLTIVYLLKEKSNENTLELFNKLYKAKSFDKEKVFQELFHLPYEANKDYLLRNEIRLLNKFLEEYLVNQEIHKKNNIYKQKVILLQFYLDKKQIKLFDEEWNDCYKKWIKENNTSNHYFIFELIQLRAKFLFNFQELNTTNFKENYHLFIEVQTYIDSLSMEIQYEYQVYIHYIRKYLFSLTRQKEALPIFQIDYVGNIETLHTQTQIHFCRAKIYSLDITFEEKLPFFEKLITLHHSDAENLATVYTNLGVEYFMISDIENAFINYNKAYQLICTNQLQLNSKNLSVIFNLISAAVSLNKSEEAIAIYLQHKEALQSQKHFYHNLERIIAIAHLFTKNYSKAYEFMPHNINERGKNEYYYYRAVYALAYYLNDDFDLALRETENAYRALKANPFITGEYEKLFLAIKHLVKAKGDKHPKDAVILEYLEQEKNIGFHLIHLVKSLL